MFGGLGGALKNLTGKAEEMMEKTKKSVEELTGEKKAAATTMAENQVKKTGDALMQVKSDAEKTAVESALDTKKTAIEGFDREVSSAEKAIDGAVQEKKEEKKEPEPAPSLPIDPAQLAATALGGLSGVEKEIDKAVDGAMQQVSTTVDAKMKETDQFLDDKRDQVVKQVQDETNKAAESTGQGMGALLGKAKGFLNF